MARYSFNDLGASIEKNFPQLHQAIARLRSAGPAAASLAGNAPQLPAPSTPAQTTTPEQFASSAAHPAPHPAVQPSPWHASGRGNGSIQAPIRINP